MSHIASRLDYWLLQKDLTDFVQSVDIRPAIKGDHNAISLKLSFIKTKKWSRLLEI